jgi:hypothetical protein
MVMDAKYYTQGVSGINRDRKKQKLPLFPDIKTRAAFLALMPGRGRDDGFSLAARLRPRGGIRE